MNTPDSVETIIASALAAVKKFGTYTAQDAYFKAKTGEEAGRELIALLDAPQLLTDGIGRLLVQEIVGGLDDMDEDWFTTMLDTDPRLGDLY